MSRRQLNEWVIGKLLRATLTPQDYEDKILSLDFNLKYIFIKPTTLRHADSRWEIKYHDSKAKYVSFKIVPLFQLHNYLLRMIQKWIS